MYTNKYILILCFFLTGMATGCKKYLEAKPSINLAVPSSLNDLQALMDYYPKMNNVDPASPEISADDYYLTDPDWSALPDNYKRMYTWEKDNLFTPGLNEWYQLYEQVYIANTVLEAVEKVERTPQNFGNWNNVKGQALFFRGKAFLTAAFIWAKAYNITSADTEPGIPLRLSTDFNLRSVRSSVAETYTQVIADLSGAADLLPVTPLHKMRPSRPAAFGLLARAFLSMRQYKNAGTYADSCLALYNTLLDYNNVNAGRAYPFTQFNIEDIFHSRIPSPAPIINTRAKIDSSLYQLYNENDLRKTLFFKKNANGSYAFRGSYEGNPALYSGVSVNEIYLIRAEAFARENLPGPAIDALNTLMVKRWKENTFIPIVINNADSALAVILQERRKELLMRGLRWMDIKRLNEEGAGIIVTRKINGQVINLSPKDPRFALPIPEDVIALSGMKQNPR
jgi:hypothetical protein